MCMFWLGWLTECGYHNSVSRRWSAFCPDPSSGTWRCHSWNRYTNIHPNTVRTSINRMYCKQMLTRSGKAKAKAKEQQKEITLKVYRHRKAKIRAKTAAKARARRIGPPIPSAVLQWTISWDSTSLLSERVMRIQIRIRRARHLLYRSW